MRHRLLEDRLVREPDPGELDDSARGLTELTVAGLAVVAAELGLTPSAAVRTCGLSGGGPEEPFGQRRPLTREAEHALGVSSLFLGLYRAVVDWRRRGFEYWVLAIGQVRYEFRLEYDRGTEREARLVWKFEAYRRLRGRVPTLLVVTDQPRS